RVFTKVMRPMMAFMRSLGVRVLGMIDDYMWAEQPERVEAVKKAVQAVLPNLGWRLNAKCVWEPADEVLMLGMLINTKEFQVRAPEKKIETALQAISAVLTPLKNGSRFPTPLHALQRVTGLLMSMVLALPAVRVYTRDLYRCIAIAEEQREMDRMAGRGRSARACVHLSEGAKEELEFWQTRLRTHNGLPIDSRETAVEVLLWSDRKSVGWGGEAAGVQVKLASEEPTGPVEEMVYGSLPQSEIGNSSTRRELVGLLSLARTPKILEQIRGRSIKV